MMMLVAPQVPRLVARFGPHRVVARRPGFIAAGLVVSRQLGADSSLVIVYYADHPDGGRHGRSP